MKQYVMRARVLRIFEQKRMRGWRDKETNEPLTEEVSLGWVVQVSETISLGYWAQKPNLEPGEEVELIIRKVK